MKEEYNIWNVYNALSAFKKCHELFECERRKAKALCEVGLLQTDVLQTAADIVITQMKTINGVNLHRCRKREYFDNQC